MHNHQTPLSSEQLALGYSFCPNDTFIFYALQAGRIALGPPLEHTKLHTVLEDVQTLNDWAKEGRLPITKISYRAFFEVLPQYVALRAGGALGRGVGPLLVGLPQWVEQLEQANAGTAHTETIYVASPGDLTTAQLLLQLSWQGRNWQPVPMRYDQIMPAVKRGEYQGQRIHAGLIIHESRFTYQQQGLALALDLGAWWEQETQLPLPLGAILVRRDMPQAAQQALNVAVQQSLAYAWAQPQEARDYIRQHALEMSDEVMQAHIDLYVNEHSHDVGAQGEAAVQELYRRAVQAGVVQASSHELFVSSAKGQA